MPAERPDPDLKTLPPAPLTEAETTAIAVLLAQNVSLPEIAALLSRSPQTIRHICTAARSSLESYTLQAADDWKTASRKAARRGIHKPARDLLIATKVIDPPFQKSDPPPPGMTVQIGFALPGLPTPVGTNPPVPHTLTHTVEPHTPPTTRTTPTVERDPQ